MEQKKADPESTPRKSQDPPLVATGGGRATATCTCFEDAPDVKVKQVEARLNKEREAVVE